MRSFGRIETNIWQSAKFRRLSERGQRLWLYMVSCPHGNSLGCFVLPVGYIMADLSWDEETVSEHVSELVSKGFIERDGTCFLTRILGWWGHNTIENGNVAKGAIKAIRALPRCAVFDCFISELNMFPKALANEFRNAFPNDLANGFETKKPEPEPEPEPEPKRGADAPACKYAFEGKVARLAEPDFEQWAKSYAGGDRDVLAAWMQERDDWLAGQPDRRKDWFNSTSSWLRRKATERAEKLKPPPKPQNPRDRPLSVGSIDEALRYSEGKRDVG